MQGSRRLLALVGLSAVVLLAVAMLLALPGGAYGESADAPNAQATAPARTPFVQDDWERIQKAGKMIVGTSADYPPFEYYDANFDLTGFDIALMEAIAKELGVEIEWKDFAFEGLGDALRLNQIDAVIAAESVTPEREAVVDFTNVYFVGEDAILARRQAPITNIKSLESLAGLRVGVQTATVYEYWLKNDFVETGKLPEKNLMVYADIQQAVRDLKRGLIDGVVLDAKPAEAFVEQGGVKIVGRNLNPQEYAIAVREGSHTLRGEINRALVKLQNNGTVAKLLDQYLDVESDDILPVPTPAPTATPAPAQPTPVPTPSRCVDGSAYVADLSYNDNNMKNPPVLQPNQPFKKGWRIKNTGTCTWDATYSLNYVNGNTPYSQMGGASPTRIGRVVPPGAVYDVYINMVAPPQPYTYQGFWQMRNDLGQPFGEKVYVGITVPAPPTPTPPPTAVPNPSISFTVDRTNIKQGECVTFSWSVQNVKAVYFYKQGDNWANNGVAGQGSRTECPPQTTTYELRVEFTDGRVEIRQITIYVEAVASAPRITFWEVVPKDEAVLGQCVDIRWQVEGNVNDITVREGGNVIWGGAPLSGSVQNCPSSPGEKEYVIEASGPGGRDQRVEHVTFRAAPQPR